MFGLTRELSIGLDISDSSIEVALVEKTAGRYRVLSVGRTEMRPGIVDQGRIKDKGELARLVKKVFETANIVPTRARMVIAGLPESKTYIHFASVPETDKNTMKEYIEKETRRAVPLASHDLVSSYAVMKKDAVATRVIIAAASKMILDEWNSFFGSLGLPPVSIEPEIFAVYRGLADTMPQSASRVGVLDCGAFATTFYVFTAGALSYSHTVPMGGEQCTRAISKKIGLNLKDAEKQKHLHGFSGTNPQVLSILIKEFEPVVHELHSALDMREGSEAGALQKIICVGGSSMLPGLAKYLSSNVSVPVEIGASAFFGSLPKHVDITPNPSFYVEAIGLALRTWYDGTTPLFEGAPQGHAFARMFPWRH